MCQREVGQERASRRCDAARAGAAPRDLRRAPRAADRLAHRRAAVLRQQPCSIVDAIAPSFRPPVRWPHSLTDELGDVLGDVHLGLGRGDAGLDEVAAARRDAGGLCGGGGGIVCIMRLRATVERTRSHTHTASARPTCNMHRGDLHATRPSAAPTLFRPPAATQAPNAAPRWARRRGTIHIYV